MPRVNLAPAQRLFLEVKGLSLADAEKLTHRSIFSAEDIEAAAIVLCDQCSMHRLHLTHHLARQMVKHCVLALEDIANLSNEDILSITNHEMHIETLFRLKESVLYYYHCQRIMPHDDLVDPSI